MESPILWLKGSVTLATAVEVADTHREEVFALAANMRGFGLRLTPSTRKESVASFEHIQVLLSAQTPAELPLQIIPAK